MARDRKKECWDQYTKDTEEVAKFLKGQGVRFHCRTELLETPKPDRSHRSHDICLYNFTPIAEHLAKQGTFSVPADIIDTVDRVIELRTECNRIHMETRTEKTAADERHLHAIQIFREIRKHLGPKKEARPATLGAEAETMPDGNCLDADSHLADMSEPQAAGGLASPPPAAMKPSLLLRGLKRIRHALQRCCSRRKANVDRSDLVWSGKVVCECPR